jgi:butyrate kinase
MMYKILAINPGSTSTKIAVYANEKEIFFESLNYPSEELAKYNRVADQFEMRKKSVLDCLCAANIEPDEISAVVGRGGHLKPQKTGAYLVNELMYDRLKNKPFKEHASNLGALIAYDIAKSIAVTAFIYDSVSVDEMDDIARISGIPDIERPCYGHYLNPRAVAIKAAKKRGTNYSDMNFIVAHIGGGTTINVHIKGRVVDTLTDEEGPFSAERAGGLPADKLMSLCFSGKYSQAELQRKLRGNGGLSAYLNTTDAREVQKRIEKGDEFARLIYEAMAYQISKSISSFAATAAGNIDLIILTGGMANSKILTSWIENRVSFIAPVEIMPGENEMEALALGVLRVLRGEEKASHYVE